MAPIFKLSDSVPQQCAWLSDWLWVDTQNQTDQRDLRTCTYNRHCFKHYLVLQAQKQAVKKAAAELVELNKL